MPNLLFLPWNERFLFTEGFFWVDKLRTPVDRIRVVTPHVANTGRTSCLRNSFLLPFFTHRRSTSHLMSWHLFLRSILCPHSLHHATVFFSFLLHPMFILLAFAQSRPDTGSTFAVFTRSASYFPRPNIGAGGRTLLNLGLTLTWACLNSVQDQVCCLSIRVQEQR